MRRILCIVTSAEDSLSEQMISAQQRQKDCLVEVFRLKAGADYEKLLDAIFEADAVQVW